MAAWHDSAVKYFHSEIFSIKIQTDPGVISYLWRKESQLSILDLLTIQVTMELLFPFNCKQTILLVLKADKTAVLSLFIYHYYKKYKKKQQKPPPSISSSTPQDILSNPIKASVFDFKWSTCCAGCNANPICV